MLSVWLSDKGNALMKQKEQNDYTVEKQQKLNKITIYHVYIY